MSKDRELTGNERFVGNDELVRTRARTFELVQYITAPLNVESMADLPSQMQDQVLEALERKAAMTGLKLAIAGIRCDEDVDEPVDSPKRYYLHIVASEVIVGVDNGARVITLN